jgi:hypothetical protein
LFFGQLLGGVKELIWNFKYEKGCTSDMKYYKYGRKEIDYLKSRDPKASLYLWKISEN